MHRRPRALNVLISSLPILLASPAGLAAPIVIAGPGDRALGSVACGAAESEFQMAARLRDRVFATLERRPGGVLLRTEGNEDETIPAAGDVFIVDGGGCVVSPAPASAGE